MRKEPLKGKLDCFKSMRDKKYPDGECPFCYHDEHFADVIYIKSAIEWLLSKRVFKKCKGKLVNTDLEEMYVFKKEDFEEAFEDVIK